MGVIILWPDRPEALYRPDGETEGYDLDGATVLEVEDPFSWDAKTVDWGALAIVDDLVELRNRRWEAAKAYRAVRQAEPLSIPGVVPGETIVAQRDADGQAWIDRMVAAASAALIVQQPLEISFTDFTNQAFTIDASQILAIGQASLTQQALCHASSQAIRAQLDAATTAAEIAAVDIEADYPA